jgi:cytochrome c-type biogenesis protein CcmE
MSKNRKFIIGGIIVLVAAVILGYIGFMGLGTPYYYNISTFNAKADTFSGKTVEVSGIVQPDAAKNGLTWTFTLKDVSTSDTLAVNYSGAMPDTFQVGGQIVVEGKYNASTHIFEGTSIIVKCASKSAPGST